CMLPAKRINPQQRLLRDMFSGYDHDALSYNVDPDNPESLNKTGVSVKFGAKLVRIIGVNERGNTMQTEWWVQQHWVNKDMSWNVSQYGGVEVVYVSPGRIWTPDILLYNRVRFVASAEENDRLAGGTEKYKTHIKIVHNGAHSWYSPAMFKSTCNINTRFFPFDDQKCLLEFGSWAFDASQVDLTVDKSNTGIKDAIYQANTEWELLDFKFGVEAVTYLGFPHPYPKVVLEVHLRRRYYYYLVNLVVPCSLIAVMVLLSFVLPPEAGERISLGITVLMAMAIFQELTSEKLPVESTHTPLLAQYYSSAIAEIGLALLATSIILNFHYRKTRMPTCLRTIIFSYLGPIVRLRNKAQKFAPSSSKLNSNCSTGNCELKTLKLLQNESMTNDAINTDCDINHLRETSILDDRETTDDHGHDGSYDPQVIEANSIEWQRAARILDRFVLLVAIIICLCTFGAIFIQAPRVRAGLFGTSIITLEQQRGLLR
ncbi:hypothetical protein QZH41_016559, partial [Actinostola sp. cb2023]